MPSLALLMFIICSIVQVSKSLGYNPIFSDSCVIAQNGQTGKCVLAIECPALIPTLASKEHTVCGYKGLIQIVCCPIYGPQATTATTTSTERITDTRLSQSISEQKCFQYHNPEPEPELLMDYGGVPPFASVGGVEAIPSEYPHMALIGYPNGKNETIWMCGGSLISEHFVLTAAHCISTRNSERPDRVKLGVHSISRPHFLHVDHSIEYTIAETITHPQYRSRAFYHDIGLLRLTTSVYITEFVRPACLPVERTDDEEQGTIVVATGWGNTAYKGMASDRLVKVELELYNDAECRRAYEDVAAARGTRFKDGIDARTQICAGSHTKVRDTCEADSGGPLQMKQYRPNHWDQYTIIGVTSFGKPCGFVNSPGVYTRVHAYLEWIENIVWSQT